MNGYLSIGQITGRPVPQALASLAASSSSLTNSENTQQPSTEQFDFQKYINSTLEDANENLFNLNLTDVAQSSNATSQNQFTPDILSSSHQHNFQSYRAMTTNQASVSSGIPSHNLTGLRADGGHQIDWHLRPDGSTCSTAVNTGSRVTKLWLDDRFPEASPSVRKRVWAISQLPEEQREAADRVQLHIQGEKLAQILRAVSELQGYAADGKTGKTGAKNERVEFVDSKEINAHLRTTIEKVYGDPTRASYDLDFRSLLTGLHDAGLVPKEYTYVSSVAFTQAVEKAASWVSTSTVKRLLKDYSEMTVEYISNVLFPGYEDKEDERISRAALMRWFNGLTIEEQISLADSLHTEDADSPPAKRQKGRTNSTPKKYVRDQFGKGLSSRISFMSRFSLFLKNHLGGMTDTEKTAFIANCLAEDRKTYKTTKGSRTDVGAVNRHGDDERSDRDGNESDQEQRSGQSESFLT